jgi:hypothetical protein
MRFLALLCLSLIALSTTAQTITATEASKHVGEHATVCGIIASEHTATSSRGTPTFINLDKPYPNQVFTILVWGDERASIGQIPTSGKLCASGLITLYRGAAEIVLHDSKSWYVPQ